MSLLAVPGLLAAEAVKLRYSPLDGQSFITESTITRISEIGEGGPKTDVSKTETRTVVNKAEDGFANTVTVLSTTFEREGYPIASPLFSAMVDLDLTYNLTADGALKEIAGYEKLVDNLKAKFPPAISQTMAPLLNYHSIKLRDEADYRERYETLIGRSFVPGSTTPWAKAHPLPYGGTILLYAITEASEVAECGNKRCISLTHKFNSNPKSLVDLSDEIDSEGLGKAAEGVEAKLAENHNSASISGTGKLTVEVDTLLLHSFRQEHDIVLEIAQTGKGPLKITMNEVKELSSRRETAK